MDVVVKARTKGICPRGTNKAAGASQYGGVVETALVTSGRQSNLKKKRGEGRPTKNLLVIEPEEGEWVVARGLS